ncbi:hypothetical protein SDJN03_05082, partial [Cucurbita argyrosperma subsp. sororia]
MFRLQAAESKIGSYNVEVSSLRHEIEELKERLETTNARAQSFEKEARILQQEKVHLDQKYLSEFQRFDEVQERCRLAELGAKKATEIADKARNEASAAQEGKNEMQRLAMERLAQIERAERQIENLERQNKDLVEERTSTVQVLQGLLDSERSAHAEANNRAEALSLQLQSAHAKIDLLQQEVTKIRLNETALDSKLKTASHAKRLRADDGEMGMEHVQDKDTSERILRVNKRSRSTNSPMRYTQPEDGGSIFEGNEDNHHSQQPNQEDYTKFTVQKLRQELTKHNFGAELLQLKNPNKKDILALYEKCVLKR